jgi:hypothetical protein
MAIINFGLKRGEDFYVRDQQFLVSAVHGPKAFAITRTADGRTFDLVDDRVGQEVASSVRVLVGKSQGHGNLARVTVEAPLEIPVDRGESYRRAGGHKPRYISN